MFNLEFQAEISASLESLQNKLEMLKNTKEKWEETKTYIKVKKNFSTVSSILTTTPSMQLYFASSLDWKIPPRDNHSFSLLA